MVGRAVSKITQATRLRNSGVFSENAVRITISVAIDTYHLIAIVQYDMKLKHSAYALQILSISLTDKNSIV